MNISTAKAGRVEQGGFQARFRENAEVKFFCVTRLCELTKKTLLYFRSIFKTL